MDANRRPAHVCPKLYYDDAPAAIEFLSRAFGFRKRLVVPGPNDTIVHAELSLGDAVIMVGSARPQLKLASPRTLGGINSMLCIYVADPDAHHARAKQAGARILQPPQLEASNGSRSYGAEDPEGNHWHFGTYVPGAYWTE